MNRVVKATILTVAALATIASTVELASAGDRQWRRHHAVKPWKKRVVIGGVAAGIVAGAVVAARPRVVYREEPVIVDEPSFYDDEAILGDDDDLLLSDPENLPERRVLREAAPVEEEYADPAFEDEEGYQTEESFAESRGSYFPEKPDAGVKPDGKRIERRERLSSEATRPEPAVRKQVRREETTALALKPWSKEWKNWCAGKFPSFNPQNGTYLGYDGKRHFCKTG